MTRKFTFLPLTFIWLGFVLAISFFETPLKFQVVSIEKGVEIGQLLFTWMNRLELLFVILLSLRWVTGRMPTHEQYWIAGLAAIVLFQMLYLLPVLQDQSQMLFDGLEGRNPVYHTLFVGCELTKVVLLVMLGRNQLRSVRLAG